MYFLADEEARAIFVALQSGIFQMGQHSTKSPFTLYHIFRQISILNYIFPFFLLLSGQKYGILISEKREPERRAERTS